MTTLPLTGLKPQPLIEGLRMQILAHNRVNIHNTLQNFGFKEVTKNHMPTSFLLLQWDDENVYRAHEILQK